MPRLCGACLAGVLSSAAMLCSFFDVVRSFYGLFQANAEDVPVSLSGHLVAADRTSEEQFWRGL